jgi:hypothetical protein
MQLSYNLGPKNCNNLIREFVITVIVISDFGNILQVDKKLDSFQKSSRMKRRILNLSY